MAATEHVILVNENDRALGTAEKLEAHRKGLCHRAFSVFIFRKAPQWEVLLQQRAPQKYHSPNLWTNACCSHPRPGEELIPAAQRRLKEELGLDIGLKKIGQFHYTAHFNNGLIENEVDHVVVGLLNDQAIQADPQEIQAYRWAPLDELKKELRTAPEQFTPWFDRALEIALSAVI